MKKTRFLFALLMAIVMMAMSPAKALAEDVASVTIGGNTTNYDDFTNAFTAAATGTDAEPATLKLLADYQNPNYGQYFLRMASGTMTIDLNGHNITGSYNQSAIRVEGAKLTITDTSSDTKGLVSSFFALDYYSGSLTIMGGVYQGSQCALYANNPQLPYIPGSIVLRGGKFIKTSASIQVPSSSSWDILNMTEGENEYIFVDESGNKVDMPDNNYLIDKTVSVVLPHSHVAGTGDKIHECTICGIHQGSIISVPAGVSLTDAGGQSISSEDYVWEGDIVNIVGTVPEVVGKLSLGFEATTAEGSKLQIKNNSFAMAGSDVTISFSYMDIPTDPLCFEALEAGAEIYFNYIVSDYLLYYSTDNKQTWTQFDYDENYYLPTLANVGDKIYLCGKVTSKSYSDRTNIKISSGKVAASGKLSSILVGVTIIPDYGCYGMFGSNSYLVSAPDMSDITEIGNYGCYEMFSDCYSLTTAPDMRSLTTIKDYGCYAMYEDCTLLATVPNMSKLTTIDVSGCRFMFYNCSSLTTAPDMSKLTTIDDYGCYAMYGDCTLLATVPNINSLTTIGVEGCEYMFSGCTSLTTAPAMNSLTTVGVEGCEEMFSGCTSLTTAPAMHSLRTVGNDGFYLMFDDCTNLTGFELNTIPNVGEDAFDDFGTDNITLNLSDDSYVYKESNPYFPTVASVTYNRQMSSQWGTLCLPFDMPINVAEPYDFYELTSATSAELTMTKLTGTLLAGTPVLVRRNASESGINLVASEPTIVNSPVTGSEAGGLTMTGTFEPISITSGYYLASDGLVYDAGLYYQEHGTGVSIGRFRAWFEGSLPSGARGLSLSIEDEETSSLDAIDALTSGKAMIFDLGGNLIDEPQQGVNIVKYANGKSVKVIIK